MMLYLKKYNDKLNRVRSRNRVKRIITGQLGVENILFLYSKWLILEKNVFCPRFPLKALSPNPAVGKSEDSLD